jgi:hypothetical protein
MKQRKIAISLAVITAIAAPFVSGAYWTKPHSVMLVPLSQDEEAEARAVLAETSNCKTHLDRVWQIIDEKSKPVPIGEIDPKIFADVPRADPVTVCNSRLRVWQAGGYFRRGFSLSKYLAINLLAAALAFIAIFGLSYLLPALARRHWRWLNT